MIHVIYRSKGLQKAKRTFFSTYEEFAVWMLKQHKNIEIKNMSYGG